MTNSDLARLADDFWTAFLQHHPTEAHLLGDYRWARKYEDASRASEDAWISDLREVAAQADAMPTSELDTDDQLTQAVLSSTATAYADVLETRLSELSVDPIFGIQTQVPIVLGMVGLPDAEVAEAMLDKLRGVATQYDQRIERLREGISSGRVPARFAIADTITQLDAELALPLSESPVLRAVPAPPAGVDEAAWRDRVRAVFADAVAPA
ncbi:MAG: DUF885 family protein, partial [Nocardioides sp.]